MNGPGTITVGQAARLLGITEERVRQLARAGVIPKAERGVYPLVGAVQGYIRWLKDADRRAAHSDNRVRDARTREIEIRIAEKERSLIPIEDHRAVLGFVDRVVAGELAVALQRLPPGIQRGVAAEIAKAKGEIRKARLAAEKEICA